ncbi:MAG: glycosyltransferase family 2 protein [Paracoccaceae bacterium]
MRWKRRRLLWRSFRSRHQLKVVADRTRLISADAVLLVGVLRNEATRIPYFLEYYRALGVDHFLLIDNESDDGSNELLASQSDVSLWKTNASYKESRFGVDWMTWLQMQFADDHWCLTVDVDELLVSPFPDLKQLTSHLEEIGQAAYGAIMLDLYPQGPVGDYVYIPGQNPLEVIDAFDPKGYRASRQYPLGNLWLQGGARERMFFADDPRRSPTLNKLPLVRWNKRYAYVNSTHSILPARLNGLYEGPGGKQPSGALLHTKFLPEIVSKSEIEKERAQHFHTPEMFDAYYDAVSQNPDFWHPCSERYQGFNQLERLRLVKGFD